MVSAVVSTSSRVSRARNSGSSSSGLPCDVVSAATFFSRAILALMMPVPATPVRSLPSRNFAVVPAPVLLADELVGRDPDVVEEDLVDLVAAVDEADRPDGDAGRLHVDQHERDAELLLGLGVGPDQAEDPVGPLRERGPRLLAVDHVGVAVADGPGGQRREVGPGVGLGEPLAPPDVEVGRRRQEPLLQLLAAERRDHRPDHGGVERQRRRNVREGHLLGPDVPLQRRPVLATPRDRPVRHGQAVRVQDLLGGDEVLARHMLPALALRPDLGWDLGPEERAHPFGECQVFFAQGNVHVGLLQARCPLDVR